MNMEQAILDAILPFVPHDPRGGGKAAALAAKQWCKDNGQTLEISTARREASRVWQRAVLDELIDGFHSQIRERKPGYYWVRPWLQTHGDLTQPLGRLGPWIIAEWEGYGDQPGHWIISGREDTASDGEFANIGPMVTMPDGLPIEPDIRD